MHETENSMYAVQMVLTIKQLQKSDFGGYKCISKNSIGGIEATIRLYGKLGDFWFDLAHIRRMQWNVMHLFRHILSWTRYRKIRHNLIYFICIPIVR